MALNVNSLQSSRNLRLDCRKKIDRSNHSSSNTIGIYLYGTRLVRAIKKNRKIVQWGTFPRLSNLYRLRGFKKSSPSLRSPPLDRCRHGSMVKLNNVYATRVQDHLDIFFLFLSLDFRTDFKGPLLGDFFCGRREVLWIKVQRAFFNRNGRRKLFLLLLIFSINESL